ncbi:MAG: hypothetical protein HMLKMBBP_03404 [Planctomycetes bacterium]|nr:hypothetical protein [Planctomycetota bacterium]
MRAAVVAAREDLRRFVPRLLDSAARSAPPGLAIDRIDVTAGRAVIAGTCVNASDPDAFAAAFAAGLPGDCVVDPPDRRASARRSGRYDFELRARSPHAEAAPAAPAATGGARE